MDLIGKLIQAEQIGMVLILSFISVDLIGKLVRNEKNLDGIHFIDYLYKLD